MDIKGFIEWIGHDSGSAVATIFPYLLVGLVGLYVLWLVVGYLRVSQVGAAPEGHAAPSAVPLPAAADGAMARPRGVPYCPVDHLQFPADAQFCPRCEGDLSIDCPNCGTTIQAADESCFHCGTHQVRAAA
jgi:Double zinc ribbon